MRKNKLFIFILASFILGVLTVFARSSRLYLDPSNTVDSTLTPGETFIVNVNVADVVDLYGYDFKLSYDPNILNALNVTRGQFFYPTSLFCAKRVIDNTEGYVRVACIPQGKKTGVSGSGTLETITFQVIGAGESDLYFSKALLGNHGAKSIDHEVEDGYFNNIQPTTTTTTTTTSTTSTTTSTSTSISTTTTIPKKCTCTDWQDTHQCCGGGKGWIKFGKKTKSWYTRTCDPPGCAVELKCKPSYFCINSVSISTLFSW